MHSQEITQAGLEEALEMKQTDAVRCTKRKVRDVQEWIDKKIQGSMDYESILSGVQSRLQSIAMYRPSDAKQPQIDAVPQSELMKFIMLNAARWHNIEWMQLLSKTRTVQVSSARHLAIYVQREVVALGFKAIGKFWGMDHSSAIYAHNKVTSGILNDFKIKDAVAWVTHNAKAAQMDMRK